MLNTRIVAVLALLVIIVTVGAGRAVADHTDHDAWPFGAPLEIASCDSDSFAIGLTGDRLCDGMTNPDNRWASSDDGTEHWGRLNLTGNFTILAIRVLWWDVNTEITSSMRLETDVDGDGLWTAVTDTLNNPTSRDVRAYPVDAGTVADSIRIVAQTAVGGFIQILEIYVYGVVGIGISPFPEFLGGAITWGVIGLALVVAVLFYLAKRYED